MFSMAQGVLRQRGRPLVQYVALFMNVRAGVPNADGQIPAAVSCNTAALSRPDEAAEAGEAKRDTPGWGTAAGTCQCAPAT